VKSITTLLALLIWAAAAASELHPIVDVESGYLFGATADGKWIKAEEAAKALQGEMTYHVYALTQSLGEAKGGQPKPSEEDVCSDVLTVSLLPKPEKGVIALAAPWNALPRKPQVLFCRLRSVNAESQSYWNVRRWNIKRDARQLSHSPLCRFA
jgi:hypothetical protein